MAYTVGPRDLLLIDDTGLQVSVSVGSDGLAVVRARDGMPSYHMDTPSVLHTIVEEGEELD